MISRDIELYLYVYAVALLNSKAFVIETSFLNIEKWTKIYGHLKADQYRRIKATNIRHFGQYNI